MDSEAYTLRQEKGFVGFGKKTSGYQLTVEANLNQGNLCNMSSSLYMSKNMVFELLVSFGIQMVKY